MSLGLGALIALVLGVLIVWGDRKFNRPAALPQGFGLANFLSCSGPMSKSVEQPGPKAAGQCFLHSALASRMILQPLQMQEFAV